MALARIDTAVARPPEERRAFLHAVRDALVEALHVPEDDPTVTIREHRRDEVLIPPRHSEQYTLVEVTMFAGRSEATKRRLHKLICTKIATLGVPIEDVLVVIHEPPMENWGVQGGVPASDVDLGFSVEI